MWKNRWAWLRASRWRSHSESALDPSVICPGRPTVTLSKNICLLAPGCSPLAGDPEGRRNEKKRGPDPTANCPRPWLGERRDSRPSAAASAAVRNWTLDPPRSAEWRSREGSASSPPPRRCEVADPAGGRATALAAMCAASPPGLKPALEPEPTRWQAGVEAGSSEPDWPSSVGAPGERMLPGPGCRPRGCPRCPALDPKVTKAGGPGGAAALNLGPTLWGPAAVGIMRRGALQRDISIGAAGDEWGRGCDRTCFGDAGPLKYRGRRPWRQGDT
ncbi:hypothetical protein NDU88_004342 [Pleurodeles waltl]|uniref:Uncharacterized protein n=1 Tax=Pleurodeles waltl TaxID=8319 RepID=A0AAV7MDS4_PLEWA|nr:hypothetical protein NDU88_004342 [Pleurodeles waltl]